eukprot:4401353-Amphidinium_carterae.1
MDMRSHSPSLGARAVERSTTEWISKLSVFRLGWSPCKLQSGSYHPFRFLNQSAKGAWNQSTLWTRHMSVLTG